MRGVGLGGVARVHPARRLSQSRAQLFTADTLPTKVIAAYSAELQSFKADLLILDSMVLFTTDIWVAPNQVPYVGVTAHYIYQNWKLPSKTLGFVPMKSPTWACDR